MTPPDVFSSPSVTVALALALGMIGQVAAQHLRVPGIVILLVLGVVAGPDVLAVVQPGTLNGALQLLVGFAVAIILFEGGMSLNLNQLRREARSIRQLVTLGSLVTAVGGACAARLILGWDWPPSFLFGTLVIVTGPTVINPLLRRIRVDRKLSTVLEAEGVFGDAIGAIVAVVALEIVLSPSREGVASSLGGFFYRFGLGAAFGLGAGLLIAALVRSDRWIPHEHRNTFTLGLVLASYQLSEALMHESGIVTVTIAGFTLGNTSAAKELRSIREFKEELTVMFIGMLFVLLAADVRLSEVQALGWRGLLTVAALMFVVRPLNIAVGTWRAGFNWRERAFLSWMAPRGIVAAAVASLFAYEMSHAGIEGGKSLRALVFLVIAVTVTLQGLSGGLVARLLRVRPPAPSGFAILSANGLSRALASVLKAEGKEVLLIDSNPENCSAAEKEGYRVLYGSGLDENVLRRAHLEDRESCIGLTANDGVNFAFARYAHTEARVPGVWVALQKASRSVTAQMVERLGGRVLFGEPRNIHFWSHCLRRGAAAIEKWVYQGDGPGEPPKVVIANGTIALLPLAYVRKKQLMIVGPRPELRRGDVLHLMIVETGRAECEEGLREAGFTPAT
ncbi:MAG: cation:proton antiporter [Acidobacteriota bacterium]